MLSVRNNSLNVKIDDIVVNTQIVTKFEVYWRLSCPMGQISSPEPNRYYIFY